MELAPKRRLIVPSSSLLRFLRCGVEKPCFFTPNDRRNLNLSRIREPNDPCTNTSLSPRQSNRHLTTTTRRQATLESSLFSLDFLPKNDSFSSPRKSLQWGIPQSVQRNAPSCTKQRRWASESAQDLRKKWWDLRRQAIKDRWTPGKKKEFPSLPFLSDANDIIVGRVKGPNELKLRCTEFNEDGNVSFMDGEFKKTELIAKYGLLPRDLRKIDSSLLPSIIVRPFAILINLLHLRVLIKHNRVLVFNAYGSTDSYTQSLFMYDLEGRLRQKESRATGGLPFEFRALEAVLVSVTSGLEAEFDGVREPVVQVLRELEEDIDREKLRHLLIYSKKLGTFEQKARLVRDAIDAVLEDDDDLSTMYLSEQAQGKKRDSQDHSEIEMLLEAYHKVADEIVQVSASLVNDIRNTEEIVKAILDANRNSLMLLDLKFSIGTLGIGSGAFVAALYGMNLKNFIEESSLGFWGISGTSAVLATMVCVYGMHKLRKVQRVSMWGEAGRRNRGSWRNIENRHQLRLDYKADRARRLQESTTEAAKSVENPEGAATAAGSDEKHTARLRMSGPLGREVGQT